jgi:hypothetical protein
MGVGTAQEHTANEAMGYVLRLKCLFSEIRQLKMKSGRNFKKSAVGAGSLRNKLKIFRKNKV